MPGGRLVIVHGQKVSLKRRRAFLAMMYHLLPVKTQGKRYACFTQVKDAMVLHSQAQARNAFYVFVAHRGSVLCPTMDADVTQMQQDGILVVHVHGIAFSSQEVEAQVGEQIEPYRDMALYAEQVQRGSAIISIPMPPKDKDAPKLMTGLLLSPLEHFIRHLLVKGVSLVCDVRGYTHKLRNLSQRGPLAMHLSKMDVQVVTLDSLKPRQRLQTALRAADSNPQRVELMYDKLSMTDGFARDMMTLATHLQSKRVLLLGSQSATAVSHRKRVGLLLLEYMAATGSPLLLEEYDLRL